MLTAITALIAVSIGLAIGLIVQPGAGLHGTALAMGKADSVGGWLDFLKGLVPGNSLALSGSTKISDGSASTSISFNILQLLVISIAVGLATLKVGDKAEPFLSFVRSLLAVVRAILGWVIRLTPIGSAALIGTAIATYGWSALAELGTLPVTETVTERLGVDKGYAAFAIPLASTTKMDGCASIYPALAAIFVAGFYGIPLHFIDYVLIVFVSVIGSAATAGLTGAIVMLTLTLSTLGLPLEGAGLLLAIDPILDMGRTAVNVAGQVLVGVIVAKREGILDESAYYGEGELVAA